MCATASSTIQNRYHSAVFKFCDPARSMTKEEARLMFSVALEHLIIVEFHIYTSDG